MTFTTMRARGADIYYSIVVAAIDGVIYKQSKRLTMQKARVPIVLL